MGLGSGKSIAFMAGGVDACALWRAWLPYMNVPTSGYYYKLVPENVLTHDYVMVQRLGLQSNLKAMQGLRQADMRIIYDLDDFLWDVPDWNPQVDLLRKIAYGYSVCLHHADIVTVSTYPLKKAILRHHKRELVNIQTGREIPVIVCQNKIDMRFVAPRQEPGEQVIVGWAGSNTHARDFDIALPALKQLAEEFPEVIFEFAGWVPDVLQHLPNVRFRMWTPVSEWMTRFPRWGWSVALAPLDAHPFNTAKSANKMTEAGAAGIPCLASHEPPYADWCRTGHPELNYLLCAGPSSWYEKLKLLIATKSLRDRLGALAYENVMQHHSWQGGHEGWEQAFSTLSSL